MDYMMFGRKLLDLIGRAAPLVTSHDRGLRDNIEVHAHMQVWARHMAEARRLVERESALRACPLSPKLRGVWRSMATTLNMAIPKMTYLETQIQTRALKLAAASSQPLKQMRIGCGIPSNLG